MKSPLRCPWCLVLALLIAAPPAAPAATEAPEIRVGVSPDFRPYDFTDEQGNPAGFSVELIKAVADKMGLRLRFVTAPWDKLWDGLVAREVDVLATATKTPGREPFADFTVPHTETFDAFFVRAGRPPIKNLAAATGKEIVVSRNDAAHHQLLERHFSGKLILVETFPEGFRLIASGKHDALLCSKVVGELELKQAGIQGVESGPPIPDYKRVFSFAVRKGNAELLEKLNQGLLIVKTNGEYERIYNRWLSAEEPWQKFAKYFWPAVSIAIALALLGGILIVMLQWLVRRRTRDLRRANEEIRAEMAQRREAEAALQRANESLEQRVAERTAELTQSNEKLALALRSAGMGAWQLDLAEQKRRFDEQTCHCLGIDPSRFEGTAEEFYSIVHPDDRESLKAALQRTSTEGAPYEVEYRVVMPGGAIRHIAARGQLARDAAGRPQRIDGLIWDVTERKKAEEALRASEERLRLAQQAARVGTFEWNLQTDRDVWTPELEAMYGLRPGKFAQTGTAWAELIHPEDRANTLRVSQQSIQSGELTTGEWRVVWPDGSVHWLAGRWQVFKDASGQPLRMTGVNMDITDRKQAEEALRESEERFRTIVETTQAGIAVSAPDGPFLLVNQQMANQFGYTKDELLGMTGEAIAFEDGASAVRAARQALARRERYRGEFKLRRKDGAPIWTQSSFAPLYDSEGRHTSNIGLHYDITDRKKAEEKLVQVNRILKAHAHSDQALLHAVDERAYLDEVCRIIVEDCGHVMVWVGIAEQDEAKSIRPTASAGFEDAYLDTLKLTWADTERGRGPAGTAIRTGKVCICSNMLNDPAFTPWREEAIKRGYASSIALPLISDGRAFGILSIYSREPDSFSDEEVKLLMELSADFAHGISTLRLRKAHGLAEQALAAAHRQLQSIIDNAPAIVYAFDLEERFVMANAALAKLLNSTPEQMIGKSRHEFMPKEDADSQEATDRKVIQAGSALGFEQYSHLQGRTITWLTTKFPLRDAQGRIYAVAGISADITERKRAEEALRDSETKYRNLFMNMTEEVHFWKLVRDENGQIKTWRLVDINPPGLKTWGRMLEDIQGKTTDEIFGPGATEHYMPVVSKIMTEGAPYSLEDYFPNLDKWFRFTSVPFGEEHFITTGADITSTKKAQEALRKSGERLAADLDAMTRLQKLGTRFAHEENLEPVLTEIVDAAIAISSADFGNIQLLDPKSSELRIAAHRGLPQWWLDYWNNVSKGRGSCGTALRRGERVIVEDVEHSPIFAGTPALEIQLKAGIHAVQSTPLVSRSGQLLGMFSTHYKTPRRPDAHALRHLDLLARQAADIIERARSEAELRQLNETLEQRVTEQTAEIRKAGAYNRSLIEAALDPLVTIGPDGKITDVNAATEAATGCTRDELVGKDFSDYFTDPEKARAGYQQVFREGSVRDYPLEIRHRTGSVMPVLYHAAVYRDQSGNVVGVFAAARDVTERLQNERALAERANQLRALASELTQTEQRERQRLAKILHDNIQQLLVAAQMQLSLIKRADRKVIQSTAQGVDAILAETLEASRSLTVELCPPVLHQSGLAAALNWLSARMEQKQQFKLRLRTNNEAEPASPDVRAFLFDAAREMLLNAAKHSGTREAHLTMARTKDDYCRIIVEDKGNGFDPASVKPGPTGGFGLFSIQQRLVHLGGKLEIESAPGQGTKAVLTMPIGRAAATEAASVAPTAEGVEGRLSIKPKGRRINILLADDHKMMRQGLASILQFENDLEIVAEAENGRQALEMARQHRPDVVVMDVNMPVMNGIEATKILTKEMPGVKVIALSMHLDGEAANAMREAGAVAYLNKGGPSEDLVEAIRASCRERASEV